MAKRNFFRSASETVVLFGMTLKLIGGAAAFVVIGYFLVRFLALALVFITNALKPFLVR